MRTILAMLTGAVVGAAITYWLVAPSGGAPAGSPLATSAGSPLATAAGAPPFPIPSSLSPPANGLGIATAFGGSPQASTVYAFYAIQPGIADPDELERRIDEALVRPEANNGPPRQFELQQLLQQLAEADPGRALRRAAAFDPVRDPALVVAVLRAVVRTDPDAALAFLTTMRASLSVRSDIARLTASGIGGDVRAATAWAEGIGDPALQSAVLSGLIGRWSAEDPVAALRYINDNADRFGSDPMARGFANGMVPLGRGDPRALLAIVDELRSQVAENVRAQALQRLVREDPSAALAYLATANVPSLERANLEVMLSRAYVSVDAEAALAWARENQSPQVQATVLMELARTEPARALTLALEQSSRDQFQAVNAVLSTATQGLGSDVAGLAEMLLREPRTAGSNQAIETLLGQWTRSNAAAALEWLAVQGSALPISIHRNAANRLAAEPDMAAAYVDRMPREVRDEWIRAVARNYAVLDADRAGAWLERFRGEPVYAHAAIETVQGLARSDPQAALELLGSFPESPQVASAYANVASQWTRLDPQAAARWATTLVAGPTRDQVVSTVARQWVSIDTQAAEQWATTLPSGTLRDSALTALINSNTLGIGVPPANDRIWSAFSDFNVRQQVAAQAVFRLSQSDPSAARALLDLYVVDAQLRARAEQALAPAPATQPGSPTFRPR